MPASGSSYGQQWDQFYRSILSQRDEKPLWDVSQEQAAVRDYTIFSKYLSPELPIVDFGCGTGGQTAYLGERFNGAVGIDVAASAVEQARGKYPDGTPRFEAINEDDAGFFFDLHQQIGDANIYMRGVMHQILDEDLPVFLSSLKTLLGASGRLFLIEVSDDIRDYLASGTGRFSELPRIMQRTLISRLPPRGISLEKLPELFPESDFEMLDRGEASLATNIYFYDEMPIRIPAVYGVFARKKSNEQ